MNDFGAAAGVSGPSLYSYFDSKSDIANAAIERGTHLLWIALHTALRHNTTHDGALMDVVRSYVLMTEENVNLASLLFAQPVLQPQLSEGTAWVLVHAALGIVHDLIHTPHLSATEDFSSNVFVVASMVLHSGGLFGARRFRFRRTTSQLSKSRLRSRISIGEREVWRWETTFS